MNEPIVFISGSKGGVGKSLTSMALLDYLTAQQKFVHLVESDTSNPDVWKSYSKTVEGSYLNLDDVEGWIQLINLSAGKSFKKILINTPARNHAGIRLHGGLLLDSLKELGRPLVTLWVINRQRDSIELLQEYLELVPQGTVHVVCNGYFGAAEKFELYHNHPVRAEIEKRGGKSLYLPDLSDRITDEFYSKRCPIAMMAQQLPIGEKVALQRWRTAVAQMFASIDL